MEKESGAKVGYYVQVHSSNEASRTLKFFQLSLFRILVPNVLKITIEFINWAMVCNHLVMDAT
jgi:hypothetical protein